MWFNNKYSCLILNKRYKYDNLPLFIMQDKQGSSKSKVSMKTVSQGMMDVSLLTSNASQLRTALLNPKYEFYWALVSLILVSMALQITARVLMLWSDYLKDSAGVGNKRKQLQFVALIIMSFITIANALISVFNVAGHTH